MDEFLNPKSMIILGAAGGVAMIIANTLWVQFGILQALTALAVSALLNLLVVAHFQASLFHRCIYFVLNGLVIFCVAVGANSAGTVARAGKADGATSLSYFRSIAIIDSARAQTNSTDALCSGDPNLMNPKIGDICERLRVQQMVIDQQNSEIEDLNSALVANTEEMEKLRYQEESAKMPSADRRVFFQQWF